jgi:arabinofuranan 3-O-arabinosyltransferase
VSLARSDERSLHVRDDTVDSVPAAFRAPPQSVQHLRLAVVSLLLGLLVFAQSAGSTEADTKIDLAIDPARFLGRALTLWDPVSDAGQLQNQAYGYLFPIGPFFVLFHWFGLEAWSIQRLWQSVLVVAAFLGIFRLSGLLGVNGFWPRICAGLSYALAPPILIEISTISAQLTPTAALPWILIPLVRGATTGSPRRAAMASGVALLFAGGTNAAATLAVLPVPALWLVTRRRGRRRRILISYWLLAVALACAWWAIPLVLLGRFSPPFLNWIEAAQNTTLTTSLSATLRGVEHWESYLGPEVWPAGWILVTGRAAIIATSAVAAAGLAGLAHRRIPHRLFLFASLFLGLALITFGHSSPVSAPFAGSLRPLLDGSLVAFRNLHKFDPLVRLPLAIGVGILLSKANLAWWRTIRLGRAQLRLPLRLLALALALGVMAVAITPALVNRLAPDTRKATLPGWWQQTGTWLSAHSNGARALVVPGAARPVYFWGSTIDDALQPVSSSPWIARSSVPLTQPGTIRLLDVIEQRLAAGNGDASIAELLSRFGIGYVVLRNDLDTNASLATPYNIVRSTLITSPGIARVAAFGPTIGAERSPEQLVDGGTGVGRPAVEIFRVSPIAGPIELLATSGTVYANGSADDLAQLVERGLSSSRPVTFGGGVPTSSGGQVLSVATDGVRRQQASFGNTFRKSATMTAKDYYIGKRPAYDYLPDPPPRLSTMRYIGIADVSASSSGADLYATQNVSQANGPWAALDRNPATSWRSGTPGAVGQWIEIRFASPTTPGYLRVAFASGLGGYPTRAEIRTDHGRSTVTIQPTSAEQTLTLPRDTTTMLRLTVTAVSTGGFGTGVGISTLSFPGIQPQRTLDVPTSGDPQLIAFDAAPGYRDGCLDVDHQPSCDVDLASAGEEDRALDRSVQLSAAHMYRASATVRLLAAAALDAKLDDLLPMRVTASSVLSSDPRLRPGAAVDGDPTTAWSAGPDDPTPALTLTYVRPRVVTGLRITTDRTSPVAAPQTVRVDAGREHWTGDVPANGEIRFAHAVTGRNLTITVLRAHLRTSMSTLTGRGRLLPAGIGNVLVRGPGPKFAARRPNTIDFGCGGGLALIVDGTRVPMQVHAPTAAVLDGDAVTATACGPQPLILSAGAHRFTLAATAWALPRALTLSTPDTSITSPVPAPGSFAIRDWQKTNRRVDVDTTEQSLLVIRENFNSGWQATLGGRHLKAVLNDGWEQAFIVPPHTHGTVAVLYTPQRYFTAGLVVGLLAALGLIAAALWFRNGGTPGAAADGALRWGTQAALLAVFAFAIAGLGGLVTLSVVAGVRRLLWPKRRDVPVWLPGSLFLAVGISVATASSLRVFDVANSSSIQLLTLAAVCLAAISGLPQPRHAREP